VKRHGLILADPPWKYGSRCTHSKTKFGGGAVGRYDLMATADIAALPIGRDYAAKNCALALWVTGPHLGSGITVIEAWGFEFVTILFTWVKTNKNSGTPFAGPGYYTRANAELVLLGKRGRIPPAHQDVSSVILEPHPRGEDGKIIHSRKPACTYQRLERLFGDVPRLELFAREAQPGWDAIGNQLGDQAATLEPQRTLFDWQGRDLLAGGAR
jgi:N6-adenosine-specific RNA methylase IME4